MANNDLASLHPAASVFRDVIMGDMNIGGDSERLTEDISRLQPLFDYAQKIVTMAVTDNEPFRSVVTRTDHGDGTITVHKTKPNMMVISTLSLSQGTVVVNDNGKEEVTLPIESAPPLLLENMGSVGGIRFRLANDILTYPGSYSGCCAHSRVYISEDDTAILDITLSSCVSIKCELNGLTNEDIIAFKEKQYGADRFHTLHVWPRDSWDVIHGLTITPNDHRMFDSVTVTPTLVTMRLASLKETLDDISKATSPAEHIDTCVESTTSDQLMQSTVMALGDDCHRTLLHDSLVLRVQHDAILSLKKRLQTIEIHLWRDPLLKCLKLSLADGGMEDFGERSMWNIRVKDKDNAPIAVNDIGSSFICLSGTRLAYESVIRQMPQIIPGEEIRPFGLIHYYNCQPWLRNGVALVWRFNWSDLSEADLEEVEDNFEAKLSSLFSPWGDHTNVFPEVFKVDVKGVILSPTLLFAWMDGLSSNSEETMKVLNLLLSAS